LRLAPNLQVAQVSGIGYAITARDMNGSLNSAPNKLLVMIDGRSSYSPFFSGVFWDVQEPLLEDIERIEVISGPGGVLWGVNAVNAVINIITKRTGETQGALASAAAGTRGGSVAVREGGEHWRVFARTLRQRHMELASGARVDDERRYTQAGFRGDYQTGSDRYTVHGNVYSGHEQHRCRG
jgi:iron complex outermembrane recepter protein